MISFARMLMKTGLLCMLSCRAFNLLSSRNTHFQLKQSTALTRLRMSFVQDELKPYALRLHSKDQAHSGQMPAQLSFHLWNPNRKDFLHYLTDSLALYELLEHTASTHPSLRSIYIKDLERSPALKKDIEWLQQSFDLQVCQPGSSVLTYTTYLKSLIATNNIPAFVCHYYNTYFALTAGGMRIGQSLTSKLLGGKQLSFYTFEDTDPADNPDLDNPVSLDCGGGSSSGDTTIAPSRTNSQAAIIDRLKDKLRLKIDALASEWSPEERLICCAETDTCFRFGNELLGRLKGDTGHDGDSAAT